MAHLRMAERKNMKQNRRKMVFIWMAVMSVFILELFFYTWCRVQSVKVGYDISLATARQKELLKLQKNLTIELAHLKSPQRLTEMAQSRFHLVVPSPEQIVKIP